MQPGDIIYHRETGLKLIAKRSYMSTLGVDWVMCECAARDRNKQVFFGEAAFPLQELCEELMPEYIRYDCREFVRDPANDIGGANYESR